jgi:hypothetical protein
VRCCQRDNCSRHPPRDWSPYEERDHYSGYYRSPLHYPEPYSDYEDDEDEMSPGEGAEDEDERDGREGSEASEWLPDEASQDGEGETDSDWKDES